MDMAGIQADSDLVLPAAFDSDIDSLVSRCILPIKSEFLLRTEVVPGTHVAREVNNDPSTKKSGGTFLTRTSNAMEKRVKLCHEFMSSGVCKYGDSCRFSHKPLDFMNEKPEDIGNRCYLYDLYGNCPFGVQCRFGSSHIDKLTLTNIVRPESEGGVIERTKELNMLDRDVQTLIRKKKIDYNQRPDVTADIVAGTKHSLDAASDMDHMANKVPRVGNPDLLERQPKTVFPVDAETIYIAPLTTVGNLPYRRLMKHNMQADVTCGEMSLCNELLQANSREWALLRRHPCEDKFGIQLAAGNEPLFSKMSYLAEKYVSSDYVDLNFACPVGSVCDKGCGAMMMNKDKKLLQIVSSITATLQSRPITIKFRTGWSDNDHSAHKLITKLSKLPCSNRIAAIMIHGRSRLQRYSRRADWDYINLCARTAKDVASQLTDTNVAYEGVVDASVNVNAELNVDDAEVKESGTSDIDVDYGYHTDKLSTGDVRPIPIIGNGDILSHLEWEERKLMYPDINPTCMLARGALIKPWLPLEIKNRVIYDYSSSQRVEMLQTFVNYGLDHWGSDDMGVSSIRRYLLEFLSFTCRYVPSGLLMRQPQRINHRPPSYRGRDDMETLLSSPNSDDWIKISKYFLGETPAGFSFCPKHKSNSYSTEGEGEGEG